MAFLIHLDRSIFLFLNHAFANPFFDWLMPVVTEEDNWKIPILFIWLSLMVFGGKKGRITAVLLVFVILLSDQLVNFIIKPLVERVRPCFTLEHVRCLIDQPNSPSFPSSHASNMAAAAFLFSVRYRKAAWGFAAIAFLISFSRIYVGVHYPSDVLAGWCVGILCAILVMWVERNLSEFIRRWRDKRKDEKAIRKDHS
ncbi:MAG TPA: phosphatase PAP2 family protein [bacterium]